jgi:tetratricopeptide (TPR) repeat protein
MSRWVLALVWTFAAALYAQDAPPPGSQDQKTPELKRDRTEKATSGKEEVPPEEDTSLTRDDYSFNPLQSQRDVVAGDYYRKKGNFAAAARRYQTATMRNDGNSEAWLKLAQARQKLKDSQAAKVAYAKFLELDPNSKMAPDVRKTLAKLK